MEKSDKLLFYTHDKFFLVPKGEDRYRLLKALYTCAAMGDTAKDHRAMSNGFVTWDGDDAVERFLDRFDPFHDHAAREFARGFHKRA